MHLLLSSVPTHSILLLLLIALLGIIGLEIGLGPLAEIRSLQLNLLSLLLIVPQAKFLDYIRLAEFDRFPHCMKERLWIEANGQLAPRTAHILTGLLYPIEIFHALF